jgi:hypothetical protein
VHVVLGKNKKYKLFTKGIHIIVNIKKKKNLGDTTSQHLVVYKPTICGLEKMFMSEIAGAKRQSINIGIYCV